MLVQTDQGTAYRRAARAQSQAASRCWVEYASLRRPRQLKYIRQVGRRNSHFFLIVPSTLWLFFPLGSATTALMTNKPDFAPWLAAIKLHTKRPTSILWELLQPWGRLLTPSRGCHCRASQTGLGNHGQPGAHNPAEDFLVLERSTHPRLPPPRIALGPKAYIHLPTLRSAFRSGSRLHVD